MNLKIYTECTKCEVTRYGGIYLLYNKISNKVYIGQTSMNFYYRWSWHESLLEKGNDTKYLQNSYKKYGHTVFQWFIIETIPSKLEEEWRLNKRRKEKPNVIQWLDCKEIYWISFFRKHFGDDNVYNINDGGTYYSYKSKKGKEHSKTLSIATKKRFSKPGEKEKQSKRISAYFKKLFSIPGEYEKFCIKSSCVQKRAYAKHPERLIKMSIAQKKSYQKPGRLERMSKAQLIAQGRQEVRDKKSKSMTGIEWSEVALENRAKGIHESWKNKHEMLNEVLYLPIQINPKIKYLSAFIKQMMVAKIVEYLIFHKYTSLNAENLYQIMDECNILKARYTRSEFNEKINYNTYFVIERIT